MLPPFFRNPLLPLLSLCAALPATAGAAVLYDGQLQSLPGAQGWNYASSGAGTARAAENGGAILDTTANRGISAGYAAYQAPFLVFPAHPNLPVLDRGAGFVLDFSLRIEAEDHAGAADLNGDGKPDRGGFSVIVVTSDRSAVELAFWTDRVWAYDYGSSAFTQGEGTSIDTTVLSDYSLAIRDNRYSLGLGGAEILSGALRNYSSFGFPYSVANQIFMGDDTGSASSRSFLTAVSIDAYPVPLPPAWILMASGLLGIARRRPSRTASSGPTMGAQLD